MKAVPSSGCAVSICRSRRKPTVTSARASREAVEEANQRARIPFTRIVEVFEMTPDAV